MKFFKRITSKEEQNSNIFTEQKLFNKGNFTTSV